eukprot:scaffold746_cov123-Cylindrotheca_fusiformis.AAC.7
MQSSSSSGPPIVRIPLALSGFESAIEQFIQDNRPDPLSLKQIRGWSLQWEKQQSDPRKVLAFKPSHAIEGTLQIVGDYMVVSLIVLCCWFSQPPSPKFGKLYFSCHVRAKFTDNDKLDKVQTRINSKVTKRLAKDSYIAKLLTTNKSGILLAQAKIHVEENDLEERVDVSEQVSEAVKRAIWSSAESPLDVIELILQFPFLPTTLHKSLSATTELANRAKLRLLEDAMVDACEQEGEDHILEDLDISTDKLDAAAKVDAEVGKNGKKSRKKARA